MRFGFGSSEPQRRGMATSLEKERKKREN